MSKSVQALLQAKQAVSRAKGAVTGVILAGATSLALAQTSPQTAVDLVTAHSGNFLAESKDVMFAGAGLVIGALLTMKLVRLVIDFFKRG